MQLWDYLRPLTQFAVEIDLFTRGVVLLLAIGLFLISYLAFKRTNSGKFLFVAVAFFFFAAKWAIKVMDFFYSPGDFFNRAAEDIFELIILSSLFIALFKKE